MKRQTHHVHLTKLDHTVRSLYRSVADKILKKYDTIFFLTKDSHSLQRELSRKIKIFRATLHLRSNGRD